MSDLPEMQDTAPAEGGIDRIDLVEERLLVGKRRVLSGRVRLRVLTETEEEPLRLSLEGEAVEVSRVPVGREVEEVPQMRVEGDVTIVPVLEEVLVVERRLYLREEVHLRRLTTRETVETTVPLRRQRVVVERDGDEVNRTLKEGSDD